MLKVDIPAARRLPPSFNRLTEDARAAKEYVSANTGLYFGDGLINMAKGSHELIVAEIEKYLGAVGDIGIRGASEVTDALDAYEQIDQESARNIDWSYHELPLDVDDVNRTALWEYAGAHPGDSAAFRDTWEPQGRLLPLPDYDKSDQFAHAPNLWDVTSPASIARDMIWYATGLAAKLGILDRAYDPFESWVKPIAGDWTGVRQCADVFDNVAWALHDMGENGRRRAVGVDAVWTGNAADALIATCWKNSDYMTGSLDLLRKVAARYRQAADAMFELGKTVGSLIADLLDAAMVFAAEASLAVATSETLVGGAVFGAASLYEGYKISAIVKDLLDCMGRADAAAASFASASGEFGFIGGQGVLGPINRTSVLPDLPTRWAYTYD